MSKLKLALIYFDVIVNWSYIYVAYVDYLVEMPWKAYKIAITF